MGGPPPTFAIIVGAHIALVLANAIIGIGGVVSDVGLKKMNPVRDGLLNANMNNLTPTFRSHA